MIRKATEADIPRIVEMGSRSLVEGPYKYLCKDNPEQSAKLALEMVQGRNGTVLVAEEADGKLSGLIAFLVYPHYYNAELTGAELMWWVEPEYRRSFTGISLMRAAERMAREAGAKRMQMTAPTEDVGKAYVAMGYSPVETMYHKAL